ncbi:MAG: zinc-ribbon domain-containing protein [Alphaproteobacteria bacterium]|nr:zinc-ribbon domain-containing protein [Alphaproteobacteria bacterium]MBP9876995.1 zinc-ribbon domain-containing protein [Alphaproteobacteria bacterium]
MLVSCQKCQAQYNVKDELLQSAPRKLRCVKCGNVWTEKKIGAPEVASINQTSAPAESVAEIKSAKPKSKPQAEKAKADFQFVQKIAPYSKWIALAASMVFILTSAIIFRKEAIAIWPPIAIVYQTAQIPVEILGDGLAFEEITANRIQEEGKLVLFLKGKIVNNSGEALMIPPFVQAVSISPDKKPIEKWQFKAPSQMIAPGQVVEFQSLLKDVNGFANNLVLRFTTGEKKDAQTASAGRASPEGSVETH